METFYATEHSYTKETENAFAGLFITSHYIVIQNGLKLQLFSHYPGVGPCKEDSSRRKANKVQCPFVSREQVACIGPCALGKSKTFFIC